MAIDFSALILRGDRASQPGAAAVKAGTLYFVTDEDLIERSTGAAWQSYSSSSSGSITLLQTKTVSGGAVQDVDFDTAIDGDVDKIYVIDWYVISGNNGADADLTLQPNSVSSAQTSSHTSGAGGSNLLLANIANGNVAKYGHGTVKFWAETGRIRTCTMQGGSHGSSGDNDLFFGSGTWTDTTTNITNFNFHSGNATGIGNGSVFSIYRVTT